MNQPAFFFDRDGTLNEMLFDPDGYRRSPRKFEELKLMADAQRVLDETKARGYLNIIISNQPELKRGLVTPEEHEKIQNCVLEVLAIDDAFICYHDTHDNCDCRKPKPGMILSAAKKWEIDLSRSYMVGDTARDTEAGKAAGVKTIIVDTPHNQGVPADYRVRTLEEILTITNGATS